MLAVICSVLLDFFETMLLDIFLNGWEILKAFIGVIILAICLYAVMVFIMKGLWLLAGIALLIFIFVAGLLIEI